MKLLILAQVPPPLHGQSLMVRTAVEGLPGLGIEVVHVDLRLSRSAADIGNWRPGKELAILDACFQAIVARFSEGCDTLYYVPAPAKRGALYRDWLVMALCRPFFRRLVLHFHNGGLGEWLARDASSFERAVTRSLLGRAALAIVLTDSLRGDAAALGAHRVVVVPNGIADPGRPDRRPEQGRVLFLGAVTRGKGALDLLKAVRLLRSRGVAVKAVFAGEPDPDIPSELIRAQVDDPECCESVGFVGAAAKREQLDRCACLCLPTWYAHEAQPLVALEALAADCPIVAARWRGLPETLPPEASLAQPQDVRGLSDAIGASLRSPPAAGRMRRHFDENFTRERHLAALAEALRPGCGANAEAQPQDPIGGLRPSRPNQLAI